MQYQQVHGPVIIEQQAMYQPQVIGQQQQPHMVMVQQQPQMVMVQQQPYITTNVGINQGQVFFYEGINSLQLIKGVIINQRFEFDLACECKDPNAYMVYPADENLQQFGDPLIRFKEESNIWARICCYPKVRPFQLNGTKFTQFYNPQNYQTVVLGKNLFHFNRPWTCTFLCCNRPFMDIFHTEDGGMRFIGKISEPFQCCELRMDVYDASNLLKYIIKGSCFQCIFWCPFPCKDCQKATFMIYDTAENPLVEMLKDSQGCLRNMAGIGDIMKVRFPQQSSNEDRVLLMAAATFMDHMYFQGQQDQDSEADMVNGL